MRGGRLCGATKTLGKVIGDTEDAGEMVSQELTDLEAPALGPQ
jgi:hypothetical protein